jgi:hypothetical protein
MNLQLPTLDESIVDLREDMPLFHYCHFHIQTAIIFLPTTTNIRSSYEDWFKFALSEIWDPHGAGNEDYGSGI